MIKVTAAPSSILLTLMTLFVSTQPVVATAADKLPDAQRRVQVLAQHRSERAVCLDGRSNQSLQTCLREADAACAQALKTGLSDGDANYVRNAAVRCERLPTELRHDCAARMAGAGTVTGSVAGGGIYRELITTEPPKAELSKGDTP